MGVSRKCPLPKVFKYPLLSQERVKLQNSNLAGTLIDSVHPNKSPLKILKKRELGRIHNPGNAQSFKVPPIISRTGKATDFKFGRYIQRVHPNKSPVKVLEKRERGHIQGLLKVLKYPLLCQEWAKLRTSNFVHTSTRSITTKGH